MGEGRRRVRSVVGAMAVDGRVRSREELRRGGELVEKGKGCVCTQRKGKILGWEFRTERRPTRDLKAGFGVCVRSQRSKRLEEGTLTDAVHTHKKKTCSHDRHPHPRLRSTLQHLIINLTLSSLPQTLSKVKIGGQEDPNHPQSSPPHPHEETHTHTHLFPLGCLADASSQARGLFLLLGERPSSNLGLRGRILLGRGEGGICSGGGFGRGAGGGFAGFGALCGCLLSSRVSFS